MPRAQAAKARKSAAASASPVKTLSKDELDKLPIHDVWVAYKQHGGRELRNYLMEKYLPLVRYIADRIYARLPDEVDVEDLYSAGAFGLMDAIDSFKLEKAVKFETFCAPRIRGAILDELRSMDWVPRLVRSRSAKVAAARNSLLMELGREPTEEEIAQRLGVEEEEFSKLKRDSRAVGVVSLERKWRQSEGGRELREIDVIEDETQANPVSSAQHKDIKALLTKGLSRAERLIVLLYYYEEMTMKEIGATLDLSESRVSQMHSSIIARLKAHMLHREGELTPEE
ncbi:MAG: FliA/WhiG family RNA polymerase sigma factor [Planctomycetota bacterium]|nr:MAG: FliA/WhiG family RNA polymerase sigma factor [Planctomycetota bacterium]